MEKDSEHKLESLAVDGGMSNSDLTMQTQSDISGLRVERPAMRETTALGAAIAAGLAVEACWTDLAQLEEITRRKEGRRVFEPQMEQRKVDRMYKAWERAVDMSRGWVVQEVEEEEHEHAETVTHQTESKPQAEPVVQQSESDNPEPEAVVQQAEVKQEEKVEVVAHEAGSKPEPESLSETEPKPQAEHAETVAQPEAKPQAMAASG
jgi:hypothetical protein